MSPNTKWSYRYLSILNPSALLLRLLYSKKDLEVRYVHVDSTEHWLVSSFSYAVTAPKPPTPISTILSLHPTLPYSSDLMVLASRLSSTVANQLQAAEHLAHCEKANNLCCDNTDLEHLRSRNVSHSVQHVLGLVDGVLH